MEIFICTAAVSLYGVVLVDDIHLLIVDINLLVVVAVLEIVGRRG